MTPLRTIAIWLACALPLAAAPTAEEAAKVVAKIVSAYEKGAPVDAAATKDDLLVLDRKFPGVLKRVSAFQKVRTPAIPACPEIAAPANDPNGCVMAAARAAAKDLGIAEGARQESASALYLALYLGPKNGTPAEVAAAQERAVKAQSDPRVSQRSAARMRRVMAQGGLFTAPGDPGASGTAYAGTGPGYRGVNAAITEARSRSRAQSVPVNAKEVPSLSDKLSASAREDEEILKHGQDDGTWGTAIGRSMTQGKKAGSELLSYFTSGETWRRTGAGAVEMVSSPVETVRFLPGAVKAAGGALWSGVKADIKNASDEVGNFIENPTPYRGAAVVGSVALAVSNAFVISGGAKSGVRRGAMGEIDLAAKDATQNIARASARDGSIGAVEKMAVTNEKAVDPVARAIYTKTAAHGESIPFMMDQGIIEVSEKVSTSAKHQIMYKQTGPTCVFGAVCNMYQGAAGVTPTDVLAAIRRENPAYSNTMITSNLGDLSMERISNTLATQAGRTPVSLYSTVDFVRHMRNSGQPVLVAVKTGGTGRHAIVLSEAMVTKDGTVYFKTLDTNISVRPGEEAARSEKFGIITSDDLNKILASKGFSSI